MKPPKFINYENRASLGDKKLEGRYANYFKVGHNALEFIIDFGQHYSGTEEAELYTRIVTSPCYAKFLLETLKASVDQYEKAFGVIKES
jgi:hypothetical protein